MLVTIHVLDDHLEQVIRLLPRDQVALEDLELPALSATADQEPFNLREVREKAESQAIVRALARTDGNVSKTAELLGVTRPTLYNLMKKYGIGD